MSDICHPELNLATFVELLKRSKIIDAERLRRTLKATLLSSENEKPAPDEVAKNLVNAGMLTEWQAGKLLKGKYKGFFLGKYLIRRPLGQGGMGVVYEAEHSVLNTQVAVKLLPKNKNEVARSVSRFMAEARAAAKLNHPNLTRVHDCDVIDDRRFMVMELIRGTDLGELVARNGPLSVPLAISLTKQAAAGLEHAHQNGVIHRDVKPQNFLVNAEGELKVTDLGLALFHVDTPERHTQDGENNVVGTVDFVAPEQAWESTTVDRRADIYALGCTLYFMLIGKAPFGTGSMAQRIAKHQTAIAPLIGDQRAGIPPELDRLCRSMMAKKREDRVQQMADVIRGCEQIEKLLGISNSPLSEMPTISKSSRRSSRPNERWSSSELLGMQSLDSGDLGTLPSPQMNSSLAEFSSPAEAQFAPADTASPSSRTTSATEPLPSDNLGPQFAPLPPADAPSSHSATAPAYWQPKPATKRSKEESITDRSEIVWLLRNRHFWLAVGLVISCISVGLTLWTMKSTAVIDPVKIQSKDLE